MIGKVCTALLKYFDIASNKNKIKSRPILILSQTRNNDYTILPISTISRKENIDYEYDIEIEPSDYPLLNLNKHCYIRTHKTTVVHKSEILKIIGDLKTSYPELYSEVISKWDKYHNEIMDQNKN